LKANRFRNIRFSTPLRVFSPWQGKIEFPINEGIPSRCDIGEKHPDLAVLELLCRDSVFKLC